MWRDLAWISKNKVEQKSSAPQIYEKIQQNFITSTAAHLIVIQLSLCATSCVQRSPLYIGPVSESNLRISAFSTSTHRLDFTRILDVLYEAREELAAESIEYLRVLAGFCTNESRGQMRSSPFLGA